MGRSLFSCGLFLGWVGLASVTTAGCGLDDTLLLRTTEVLPSAGAGGAASALTSGGATAAGATVGAGGTTGTGAAGTGKPEVRASKFCGFKWGRSWVGPNPESSGKPAYPNNLGMISIWLGYEKDDLLDNAIREMFANLSPGGNSLLQGVTPVLYAYFVPFKAANKDGLSKNCAPNSTTANVCTEGAEWLFNNRDYLRGIYDSYARQIAATWGTERPIVWLFEPGFNDYIRSSQSRQLSLSYLSAVASDLIGTIKGRLPNAVMSHFASPDIADFAEYFGALDMERVDLVNVTGRATLDYFGSPTSSVRTSATYGSLHAATGRPIFVDTGFDASEVKDHGWLTADESVLNERISDGVVAVHVDNATSDMQTRISVLSTTLQPLSPAPQTGCVP